MVKRDFVIKFSVIVAIAVTIIVSMNLVELLDKYVKVSLTSENIPIMNIWNLRTLNIWIRRRVLMIAQKE